jgi:hypothetical protein
MVPARRCCKLPRSFTGAAICDISQATAPALVLPACKLVPIATTRAPCDLLPAACRPTSAGATMPTPGRPVAPSRRPSDRATGSSGPTGARSDGRRDGTTGLPGIAALAVRTRCCGGRRVEHRAAVRPPRRRRAGRAESVGGHVTHLRCEREGCSGRIVAVHPQPAATGRRLQPLAQVTIVLPGSPRKGPRPVRPTRLGRGGGVGPAVARTRSSPNRSRVLKPVTRPQQPGTAALVL